MNYRAENWPIKKQHMYKMDVAKMRMLRWMYGKIRKNSLSRSTLSVSYTCSALLALLHLLYTALPPLPLTLSYSPSPTLCYDCNSRALPNLTLSNDLEAPL